MAFLESNQVPGRRRRDTRDRGPVRGAKRRHLPLRVEPLEARCLLATIGGTVYTDLNNNGLFDAGEPTIANSPIELRNATGGVVDTATTGPGGQYAFSIDPTINTNPTTLSFSDTIPLRRTTFNTTLTVPRFDPSLGTLTGVTFTMAAHAEGTFQYENLDAEASTVMGTLRANVELRRPDNSVLVASLPASATFNVTLPAFDQMNDFGGTSGGMSPLLTGDRTETSTLTPPLSPADMATFVGTGNIVLPVRATPSSLAVAGNVRTQFSVDASALVSVTYSYIPSNAIRPGNYVVAQTAQPAGLLDGRESSNGAVLPGTIGTDLIPVTVLTVNDVLP
ncbi:MAG TPA: choice-of-anchor E domain-containing protein, partial [Isosphaeraceae bacterium]